MEKMVTWATREKIRGSIKITGERRKISEKSNYAKMYFAKMIAEIKLCQIFDKYFSLLSRSSLFLENSNNQTLKSHRLK